MFLGFRVLRLLSLCGLVLFVTMALAAGCGRSSLEREERVNADASGRPCTTAADCDDRNACTTDFCSNKVCQNRAVDNDGDGYAAKACGGTDCNDTNAAIRPTATEVCSGGVDDNCDGKTDCADSSCNGQPGCICGAFELCTNGVDDDCNGKVDCADSACVGAPGCSCGTDEICNNNIDDDCNNQTDCDDAFCVNSPACQCTQTENCNNGRDDNCNGQFDCDDAQCASQEACVCRTRTEDCTNDRDDNCNLLADCADPDCAGAFACSCNGRPPQAEDCTNNMDDDCDSRVDCADSDCILSLSCRSCTTENCADGIDNDCNNIIDCADSACVFAPNCRPTTEICNNGVDDDRNGLIDCFDPACRTNPLCVLQHSNCNTALTIPGNGTYTGNTTGFVGESSGSCGGAAGEAVFQLDLTVPSRVHLDTTGSNFDSALYLRSGACKGGRELACDDDSGGNRNAALDIPILYPGTYFIFVDGFTIDQFRGPDEGAYVLHVVLTPNPGEVCNNGLDDDGDRLVDCADPNCASFGTCGTCNNGGPATPEIGTGRCTDGRDNDCDGQTDCADKDCHASDFYVTECCNGIDDNGNGTVDDFSCRCRSNGDCPTGQICYTNSAFACGPPCTQFVGDICPFVAAGSSCSQATNQCAF